MKDWRHEDGLRWRSLEPFGAEIDHDLAAPLTASQTDRFVALIREAGLLVAHGQSLSMARQTELMALLGPVLRRAGETGYLSTDNEHSASRSELTFHADGAYTEHPFDALSLHAVDVVDGASSTRFASAELAYITLPAALRERLNAHAVEMISPTLEALASRAFEVRDPAAMRRGVRPAVLVNPHTGRSCVGVSEMHAARLLDMDWEESRALLSEVFAHLYAPANTTEHVWHRGDLIIWDNLTLQHARGSLQSAGRRILQRVIVAIDGVAPHVQMPGVR